MEAPVIIPTITDPDELNYLKTLKSSDLVGFPNAVGQDYYARVLRHKYPQCQFSTLTVSTFQILQPGISAVPVQLIVEQCARRRLFDALDSSLQGAIPKRDWLHIPTDEGLLPNY
jgi:hypothetical protein